MARVEISIDAGSTGEGLSLSIEEENYTSSGLIELLERAYLRALDQARAWEKKNAEIRP